MVKRLIATLLHNRWVFRLIGIGIFILILLRLDLELVWQTLLEIDLTWLVLSLVFQFLAMIAATIRWQLLMQRLGIRIRFWFATVYQLIGTAAALVTPGQLGEFVKVLYLRRDGHPLPESLRSLIVDRLYDLLTLLLFGFIAIAILFGLSMQVALALTLGVAVVLVAGFLLARSSEQRRRWIVHHIVRFTPGSYRQTMREEADRLTMHVVEFTLGFLVVVALFTLLHYLLLLLAAYAIVAAMRLDVSFWYYAMIVPLLRLVGLLPVSILGIGTRDITAIYLLGLVGISEEASLLTSTIGLLTRQLQAVVGLAAWWRYPLFTREKRQVARLVPTARSSAAKQQGKG